MSVRVLNRWRGGIVVGATVATLGAVGVVSAHLAAADAPPATGQVTLTETMPVSGSFDGGNQRFIGGGDLGDGGQAEGQDPLFRLANGATLSNVIIGAPAADGVHCAGTCTLRNVFWEDVGEDAATFRGTGATVVIDGGGASNADDKVFQDNRGAGGSVTIRDFEVANFGKLYRSCGNCSTQARRDVVISNLRAAAPGDVLVGINVNFGDTARLSGVTITGGDIGLCDLFEGNDTGDEPEKIGEGPNGTHCVVS
ncbi:pectate lyase [Actinomycetes bacterium KLBMP 9797]